MTSLSVLGSLDLRGPDGEAIHSVLSQPKRCALLTYLTLAPPRGFHRRDTLLGLFWPESDEDQARAALSSALSFLRRSLGEGLVLTRGTEEVGIDPEMLETDVGLFEQALEAADLERALEQYRGHLLEGFHLSGCSGFEQWLDMERERLRRLAAEAAWAAARRRIQEGELPAAERLGRRALDLVATDESAVREFIQALAGAGDRAAAVRFYERFAERLSEELDLEPCAETRAVMVGVRAWGESSVVPPLPFLTAEALRREGEVPEEAPSGAVALPPFVGREEELLVLEGWLQEAVSGRGRVGFVIGEAGSGKTVLAREFCRRVGEDRRELIVAMGDCNAHTGIGDPHHPFREILALLTGDVEAQWAGGSLSTDHASRLWSILPCTVRALIDHGPDLVGTFLAGISLLSRANAHPSLKANGVPELRQLAERRSSGVHRANLMDQLIRVLRSLARERPLLLLVDDLQWADSGTLDVLFLLGRRLAGSRILLLGLYRPSEVALGRAGQQHPMEPVIQELSGRFGDIFVEVGKADGRAFVNALVDAEPNRLDSSFRGSLFDQTEGHALFTVELLRDLQDQDALVQNEAGEWAEGPGWSWGRLPVRVDAIIQQRMNRVPSDLRRMLTIAAVEGAEFTLEVVAKVLAAEAQDLVGPVSLELEERHRVVSARGIRRVDGQRLSLYRFRHILFQRFLYDRLTEVERVHLHEQVAETLEELHGEHKDEAALQLAHHFQTAGLPERALTYLETAGIRARNMGAYRESLPLLEAALHALHTLPPGPERDNREIEIQLDLANERLHSALPGYQEASARAHDLAQRVGSKEQLFWSLVPMYYSFSLHSGDALLGKKLANQALGLARESEDKRLLPWGLELMGRNAHLRGDLPLALASYRELDSIYRPDEHREERFSAIMDLWPTTPATMGFILWIRGYPDQGLTLCREAVIRATDLKSPDSSLMAQTALGWTLTWRREAGAALREFRSMAERAHEVGLDDYWSMWALPSVGWCMVQEGDLAGGVECLRRALEQWNALGWRAWLTLHATFLARGLLLNGHAEEGLEVVREAQADCEGLGEAVHEAEVQRTLGDLLLRVPRPKSDEAESVYRQAIKLARGQEARSYELRAATSLARLLQSQRRGDEAREMLNSIYQWFTEGFDTRDLREAKALLDELGSGSRVA